VADHRVLEVLKLGEALLRDNLDHVESCDDNGEGC
jgi:hypothetical protein